LLLSLLPLLLPWRFLNKKQYRYSWKEGKINMDYILRDNIELKGKIQIVCNKLEKQQIYNHTPIDQPKEKKILNAAKKI
jgi:hypothetical protein